MAESLSFKFKSVNIKVNGCYMFYCSGWAQILSKLVLVSFLLKPARSALGV